MAGQYFENNPELSHNISEIKYYFKGKELTFYADNGVFSKSGIDYGSNVLLKTLKLKDNDKVLDVGCGYGTIGITIAKNYPNSFVTMVDVNLRAIDLVKRAAIANDVKNIEVFESNIYENIKEMYDVIVTNPPIRAGKKVVHEIILNAKDHLNLGGALWCVIQKKQGAPSAFKSLSEVYSTCEVVENDKGYWIIKATK